MLVKQHGRWIVTLAAVAQFVLLGGCAARVSPSVDATAEIEAMVKGFGDDLRAATDQITEAQAKAGRDLSQQIQNVSETVTTNGIPWYGLVVVLGVLVLGFVGVALLVWMFGYRKGTWKKKEDARDELAGTGGDA